MAWTIEFDAQAAGTFRRLDRPVQQRLRSFLRDRVATADNPRNMGHALTGRFSGLWRYRVGDYRIVCRLEDERLVVLVLALGHRKDIYR